MFAYDDRLRVEAAGNVVVDCSDDDGKEVRMSTIEEER